MQAILTEPPGGWENTRLAEVPEPEIQADDVLVEIRAAALNPADRFLIEGNYPGGPAPPFVAGRDAAGVVLRGDASGRWSSGTSVVVLQSGATDLARGTLCQRGRFLPDQLAELPKGWSFAEGAAAPLVYQTAWKALVDRGNVAADDVVLVTGASGGVGLAAVHLASGLGARVVALSRSEEKRRRLAEEGADHVFSPQDEQLKQKIFEAIGRKGVDLVVENVGGPSLTQSIHLLGVGGRVSVVGVLAGVETAVPIPALMFKRASIHGVLVSEDSPADASARWQKIVDVLSAAVPPAGYPLGAVPPRRPVIDSRFPLSEYKNAFERLAGDSFGKVVVEISAA